MERADRVKVVMSWQILYTQECRRDVERLSSQLKNRLEVLGALFEQNPFHPRLHTHKLTGRLRDLWSFSLDFHHRVIFEFIDSHTVLLLRAGDHSIYRHYR